MRAVVYISFVYVGVFALLTRCESHSSDVSWRQGQRNYARNKHTYYNYYRPGFCGGNRGCARGYVCRRRNVVQRSPVPRCRPAEGTLSEIKVLDRTFKDIRAAIRRRLDMFEDFFNSRNFKPIEGLFTTDSLVLATQTPIRRGNAGFAEFVAQAIEVLNWDILRYKVDTLEAVTEDFIYTVLTYVVTSSVNDPPTVGKATTIWRKTRGVYLIENYTYNFDA